MGLCSLKSTLGRGRAAGLGEETVCSEQRLRFLAPKREEGWQARYLFLIVEGVECLDAWIQGRKGLGPGLLGSKAEEPGTRTLIRAEAWELAEGEGSWAPCCVYNTWFPCPFWVGGGAGGPTQGRLCSSPLVYRPRLLLAPATLRPSPACSSAWGSSEEVWEG